MRYIISGDLWSLPALGSVHHVGPFASSLWPVIKFPRLEGEPDLRCNALISQHLLFVAEKTQFPQKISLADGEANFATGRWKSKRLRQNLQMRES